VVVSTEKQPDLVEALEMQRRVYRICEDYTVCEGCPSNAYCSGIIEKWKGKVPARDEIIKETELVLTRALEAIKAYTGAGLRYEDEIRRKDRMILRLQRVIDTQSIQLRNELARINQLMGAEQ